MPAPRARGAEKNDRSRSSQLKICSSCGPENPFRSSDSAVCKRSRVEPERVPAHRPINRQVSVQVTASNSQYGDVQERIALTR